MKAAILYLGLTVLLATAPLAYGQVSAQEGAVNEAVMRQAARISLRQKLEDAQYSPMPRKRKKSTAWMMPSKSIPL